MNSSLHTDLDEIDVTILEILQNDGRLNNSELARRVNLSQPAVYNRVKRLERQGYIESYVALLNREQIGFDLTCYLLINLDAHNVEKTSMFRERVSKLPEVLECHHVTGSFDYILKVVLRNRKDLERFVVQRISEIPGISRIQTSVVLSEIKSTTVLSLE